MAEDQDSKTEQPTGKRLSEAADRGQFARAQEIQVLFTLAAVLGVLGMVGRPAVDRVSAYAVSIFTRFPAITVRADTVPSLLQELMLLVGPIVIPVLVACCIAALVAGGLQSGFQVASKALEIRWEKLNPAEGIKNVFDKGSFVRTGIDILKIIAIGTTLWLGARKLLQDPLFTAPIEAVYLGSFLNQAVTMFFGRILAALGILAALRYSYEKYKLRQEMMMTREEVKEETKGNELDSRVKTAQRRLARRLLQTQMLDAIPTADVVVTNPTHFAVALKYERGRDRAPVVLAKGENRFAQRIKAIAAEHGVPMVENKPVARLLFAMSKVGEAIPPELYQAVAEILALVYRTHRYYFHRLRSRRLEAGV